MNGRYPELIEAMLTRQEVYNRQVSINENLAHDGEVLIIWPLARLTVNRTARNIKELLELYDEVHREGTAAIQELKTKLAKAAIINF